MNVLKQGSIQPVSMEERTRKDRERRKEGREGGRKEEEEAGERMGGKKEQRIYEQHVRDE